MGLTDFQQAVPLKRMACDAIRSSIFFNRLAPPGVYSEKRLAEQLGIPRKSVRKALQELGGQGLVAFLPCKGVVVTTFSKRVAEEHANLLDAMQSKNVEEALMHMETHLEQSREAVKIIKS